MLVELRIELGLSGNFICPNDQDISFQAGWEEAGSRCPYKHNGNSNVLHSFFFFVCLIFWFGFCFALRLPQNSLYRPGWTQTQKYVCCYLLSPGIKAIQHYAWLIRAFEAELYTLDILTYNYCFIWIKCLKYFLF